jgi:hypothetical protein
VAPPRELPAAPDADTARGEFGSTAQTRIIGRNA